MFSFFSRQFVKKSKPLLGVALLAVSASVSFAKQMEREVNIYSYRQPVLIEPIIEQFEKETGIKAKVVFAKDGLAERLEREGKYTPADVVLTVDISRLVELVDKGLTQPLTSKTLEANIPAQYRDPDNHWFALTTRVRSIYSSKNRVEARDQLAYEDLSKPEFRGKICTRSGKHPYNVALVSSMIAHHGKAYTKDWLLGVKSNLARRPQGNDRAQVKAIKEGLCDYSLGNSYYFGKMLQDKNQKEWANAANINFPNQNNRGAHVNVSGVVMTKYAKHPAEAKALMEYLSGDSAQQIYARENMEYPVKPGVPVSDMVAGWGQFDADRLPVTEIAAHRKEAIALLDEVKFDL